VRAAARFWSRTTALGGTHRQHPQFASGHALRNLFKMKRSKCWFRREVEPLSELRPTSSGVSGILLVDAQCKW